MNLADQSDIASRRSPLPRQRPTFLRKMRYFPVHTVEEGICACYRGEDCPSPGKHPKGRAWQQKAKIRISVQAEYFKDKNIGFRTGVVFEPGKKLVVLDGDGPEGCRWVESFPGMSGTMKVKSSRGYHYYVWVPADVEVKNRQKIGPHLDVDVRGDGGFVVGPGSRHVSGHIYEWAGGSSILQLPEELLKEIRKAAADHERTVSSITAIVVDEQTYSGIIKIGTRHKTYSSVAGRLRSGGYDEGYIRGVLYNLNENNAEEPSPVEEIEEIISYVMEKTKVRHSPISEETRASLRSLRAAYSTFPFRRPFTSSDKAFLLATVQKGFVVGDATRDGVRVSISERELAEVSNLARKTVQTRKQVLKDNGFISTGMDDKSGYIVLKSMVVNSEGEVLLEADKGGIRGDKVTPLEIKPISRDTESNQNIEREGISSGVGISPLSERVRELRNGPGRIGKRAGEILDVLEALNRPVTTQELTTALGLNIDKNTKRSVRGTLKKLEGMDLVSFDEETSAYSLPENLDQLIKSYRETTGEIEAQEKQKADHEMDRLVRSYELALREAAKEGEDLNKVPVPEQLTESAEDKLRERVTRSAREKQAEQEIMEKLREITRRSRLSAVDREQTAVGGHHNG